MAKKKDEHNIKEITVKDAIAELKLKDTDVVFIHKYGDSGEECFLVKDLVTNTKQLSKKIYVIQKSYGGQKHNYLGWLFIVK